MTNFNFFFADFALDIMRIRPGKCTTLALFFSDKPRVDSFLFSDKPDKPDHFIESQADKKQERKKTTTAFLWPRFFPDSPRSESTISEGHQNRKRGVSFPSERKIWSDCDIRRIFLLSWVFLLVWKVCHWVEGCHALFSKARIFLWWRSTQKGLMRFLSSWTPFDEG